MTYSLAGACSLNTRLMQYNPASPTKVYTTLLTKPDDPPNNAATRSYWNNPIRSQFKAPIMTIISASLSKGVLFIATTPFHIFYFHMRIPHFNIEVISLSLLLDEAFILILLPVNLLKCIAIKVF